MVFLISCKNAVQTENNTMVDKQATTQTKALYENLKKMNGVMFGHQDDTAYGIGWKYEPGRSDIQSVTGAYPAVYGWEIGGIERMLDYSLDSVHFHKIKELIIEAYARGGVNTISWHADNLVTGGNSWDTTKVNVVATLLPDSSNHNLYKKRLDMVADFLGSLQTADGEMIPVIFRPFHEHTGNWFWWCKPYCSTEEYVALWQFTVKYLRDEKQLHNIIYSYSPDRVPNEEEYMERYPGDDYVDLFGLDLYHFGGADGTQYYIDCVNTSLSVTEKVAKEKGKPYAFTETGLECVTVDNWFTGILQPLVEKYNPAYVLVWRNAYEKPNHYYAPYPGHPAAEDLKRFKESESILFNDEIANIYK